MMFFNSVGFHLTVVALVAIALWLGVVCYVIIPIIERVIK